MKMKKEFDPDWREKAIVRLRKEEHLTMEQIAHNLFIGDLLVSKILHKHNLTSLKEPFSKLEQNIIRLHNEGLSTPKICGSLLVRCETVTKVLRKHGLSNPLHPNFLGGYTFNERAFHPPLNEVKAYWLGYIMADGCILKKCGGLQFGLSIVDKEMVERLSRFLNFEGPLSYRKPHSNYINGKLSHSKASVRCTVHSHDLIVQLKRYGIVPNKQTREQFAPILANNRHAWRGLSDGDGCISCTSEKNGIYFYQYSLLGSFTLLNQFNDFIYSKLGFRSYNIHEHYGTYRVTFGTRKTRKIAKLLYGDCTIALPRKLEYANEVMGSLAFRDEY